MRGKLIFGLLLSVMLVALTSTQENTSVPGPSDQASIDSGSSALPETAGGQETQQAAQENQVAQDAQATQDAQVAQDTQETVDKAEVMNQMILTIEDKSEGSSDSNSNENAEGAATDVTAGQPLLASEELGNPATNAETGQEPINDAKEINHLIQVLEKNDSTGSSNTRVVYDDLFMGKNEGINQSEEAHNEVSGTHLPESKEDSKHSNQTESLGQIIQMLAETKSNNSSEIIPEKDSVNQTEPSVMQETQTLSADGDNAQVPPQVPIQGMTDLMNQIIQVLVNNETSNAIDTSSISEAIEDEESASISRIVLMLENENQMIKDDVVIDSAQSSQIIAEKESMDRMIQGLEGDSI